MSALEEFQEVNIFLRGMFPLVGFKSTSVPYKRKERMAGKSKYRLKNMFGITLDGITSLYAKHRPKFIIAEKNGLPE